MLRAQSSIEFLSTYSFLFLIMGITIGALLFITLNPQNILPSQCSSFSGPACNLVSAYSKGPNSIVTVSLSNSQGVPINITNITVITRNSVSLGACTPYLLYPGQGATCTSRIPINTPNLQIQGSYNVNARFCNSGISNVSKGSCSYEQVAYGGSFVATIVQRGTTVFSVSAAASPKTLNLISFNAINGNVLIPRNFTTLQNGFWNANITNGVMSYAFANGNLIGNTYLTYNTAPFPQTLTALTNNNIACSQPYNSILSIASTTLYMGSAGSVTVKVQTGGAMEVFYRPAFVQGSTSNTFLQGSTWNSVYYGAAWRSQTPTQYGSYSNTVTLNSGFYYLDVIWSDNCGSGAQVLQISGLT